MGCDIHSFAEKKEGASWAFIGGLHPFDWRSYGMYGFLAGVRNYSAVSPITAQRGFPRDASPEVREEKDQWEGDAHSASWLTLAELTAFDYDAPMEDRRVNRNGSGGCTCEPGEGKKTTYREFLGEKFFEDLASLKAAGAERVIFWFDN